MSWPYISQSRYLCSLLVRPQTCYSALPQRQLLLVDRIVADYRDRERRRSLVYSSAYLLLGTSTSSDSNFHPL